MKPKKPAAPARPKLATLQPRVAQADLSIGTPLKPQSNAARMRGRRGQERRKAWLAAHPLCAHCLLEGGRVHAGDEVDHIVPLHLGGADDSSNFQTLCSTHHKAKTRQEQSGSGAR